MSLVLVLALLIQIVPPQVMAVEETTVTTAVDVPVGQPSYEVLWEETSLRSEDTKHFRLTDGSFIAVNYGMAVHYQDEDGTWQDIDNTPVMAMSLEESDLQMVNGESALSFAGDLEDGSLITVSRDGVGISMSLLDTAQARTLTGEPSTYGTGDGSLSWPEV